MSLTLSLHHPLTPSPSHSITLSLLHPLTPLPSHSITLSLHHPLTPSPFPPMHLLRVVLCHFVSLSFLELITSLLQSGGHDVLHTEQWVVSEVEGGEINIQLVDFLLST